MQVAAGKTFDDGAKLPSGGRKPEKARYTNNVSPRALAVLASLAISTNGFAREERDELKIPQTQPSQEQTTYPSILSAALEFLSRNQNRGTVEHRAFAALLAPMVTDRITPQGFLANCREIAGRIESGDVPEQASEIFKIHKEYGMLDVFVAEFADQVGNKIFPPGFLEPIYKELGI